MTQDEIMELAMQGHSSTRDAIRWAINQEREACAKVCDDETRCEECGHIILHANLIRARGQA